MTKRRVFREAGVVIELHRHAHHVELVIGDVPILTSKLLGTERDFGRIVPRNARHVIVGGLGFGATVAGVLDTIRKDAHVTVVEKLATVMNLVRGELAHLANGALEDARVTVVNDDVRDVIKRTRDADAILLDVDNGPEWGSFRSNAALYDRAGLRSARAALRDGGMFAVWSGYAVDPFMKRLKDAGFRASEIPFVERGKLQARAYVGINTKSGPRRSPHRS